MKKLNNKNKKKTKLEKVFEYTLLIVVFKIEMLKYIKKEGEMPEEIKCPNRKCQSTNFINLHAEQKVGGRAEGKPLPGSKLKGPKYECLDCSRRFGW